MGVMERLYVREESELSRGKREGTRGWMSVG